MTKIMSTFICNIDETFVGIFMGIQLEYFVHYRHGHY